jgi:hypothetical protein
MGSYRPKGYTKYALTGIGTGMEEYPKKGLSGYENAILGGYYYRNRKKSLAQFRALLPSFFSRLLGSSI